MHSSALMAAKSLAIVPQNSDALPQISLIQRASQTRKSNTQISDSHLAEERLPGFGIACGTCCKRQMRHASPFTASYAFTFSRESASPENALAFFSRGRDAGGSNHGS
jgi:hypothetical protein